MNLIWMAETYIIRSRLYQRGEQIRGKRLGKPGIILQGNATIIILLSPPLHPSYDYVLTMAMSLTTITVYDCSESAVIVVIWFLLP